MSKIIHKTNDINIQERKFESRSTNKTNKTSANNNSQLTTKGSGCDESVKVLDQRGDSGNISPVVRERSLKKGRKLNLQKLKESYVSTRKQRSAKRKKTKQLSEKDVWQHIQKKNLDVFGPYVDRTKLVEILEFPKKSSLRKDLVEKLGKQFSDIYFAYRQKLEESSAVKNTYSSRYDANVKFCQKAAEACIICGVTPQFAIQYFHERRAQFRSGLKYVPLSILSNHAMIDSAAASYLEEQTTSKRGNSYEDVKKLHPLLREKLEEAGFKTHEYSDRFLLSIQVNAIDIAFGAEMFISSDIKDMVYWAAEHVYGGKADAKR